MRVETRSYEAYETIKTTKEKNIIITSDGREFAFADKERAQAYERSLESMKEFKDSINYVAVDIWDDSYEVGYYERLSAFTFEIDKDTELDFRWRQIQHIVLNRTVPPGKYLVIEYRDDNHDEYYYKGFFGTIDHFVALLEKRITDTKSLIERAKSL